LVEYFYKGNDHLNNTLPTASFKQHNLKNDGGSRIANKAIFVFIAYFIFWQKSPASAFS
jgi:hypothetical protein